MSDNKCCSEVFSQKFFLSEYSSALCGEKTVHRNCGNFAEERGRYESEKYEWGN